MIHGLEPMMHGLEPMMHGLEPMMHGLEPMMHGLEPMMHPGAANPRAVVNHFWRGREYIFYVHICIKFALFEFHIGVSRL